MAETNEIDRPLARTIHRLIDVCHDCERIFADAAKRTPNPDLRDAFRDIAESRREIIEELKPQLPQAEGDRIETGTVPGKLELLYARIEDSLGAQDLSELLDHLVATESRASEELAAALEEDMPDELRRSIRRMRGAVELSKDALRRIGSRRF